MKNAELHPFLNRADMSSTKNNRLLFVTLSLFGGGAERVVAYYCNGLVCRGWDVHLVVMSEKSTEYDLDKRVVRHQMSSDACRSKFSKASYIKDVVKSVKPFVVVPFLYEPLFCSYLATRGMRDVRLFATVRNNPHYYPSRSIERIISNHITKVSDLCLVQTKSQAQLVHCTESKCAVFPNPVSPKYESINHLYRPKLTKIVAAGRLEQQKDYPLLIEAFAIVKRSFPGITLEIYGKGSLEDALLYLIDSYGLNDSIKLMGSVPDIEHRINRADVYMMTSEFEGMPNSLMEAMAIGLPCISIDCETGPSDLISDGVTGFIVKDRKAELLAERLAYCIGNPDICERIGRQARKFVLGEYSIEKCVDAFERTLCSRC